jgi:hypothetical protein
MTPDTGKGRRLAGLLAAGSALLFVGLVPLVIDAPAQAQSSAAENQTVTSTQMATFLGASAGQPVQGLIWRGGIEMQSPADTFGGLSGLGFLDDAGRLAMVSDRGTFVTGQLIYDDAARPLTLVGVSIDPMQNTKGNELPRAYARDAESLAVVERDGVPSAVRVGFENLTRVADFQLVDGRPQGAAREVPIPKWLSDTRSNETLEAMCIAPPASAIAGSTVLLPEGIRDGNGNVRGYMLGKADKGPLSYVAGSGLAPTDCAFLPNGDLLVLERGISLFLFSMRLVLVPAASVAPEALLTGRVLLQATGGDIDNMEAVAVHRGPDGSSRITLLSDNNFNDWQRNLLLEFSLQE